MAEIVVADAGPLIAFGRLNRFSLLATIFDGVIVPRVVFEETQARSDLPDALAIRSAVQTGALTVVESGTERADVLAEIELGEGEAAAITLAAKLGYGLLIDDLQGRPPPTSG